MKSTVKQHPFKKALMVHAKENYTNLVFNVGDRQQMLKDEMKLLMENSKGDVRKHIMA